MAEENEKAANSGARRFRLPKLFAETESVEAEVADEAATDNFDDAAATLHSLIADKTSVHPAHGYENEPVAAYSAVENAHGNEAASEGEAEVLEYVAGMAQELLTMRATLNDIHQEISDLNSRESSQEKVFNTLHAELGDYKKDFIYEHLKPVVRPLLFLYDSMEQFDDEIALHEKPAGEERRGLSPLLVRQNIGFFRDQLVEALRVCEVTQMETPEGVFNAKMQKAVGVEEVEAARENHVVRVVRSGWFLNGQLLRPAEIIVGRVAKTAAS